MPSYSEAIAESRRICLLRILEAQPEYSANDSVLQIALEGFGFAESRDAVRTDLAWLEEQGVIHVKLIGDSVRVARLTARGVDVARGRVTVPGIQRPSP
jgi:hypothetical protein